MSTTPEVRFWQHPDRPWVIMHRPTPPYTLDDRSYVEVTVSPVAPQGATAPADEPTLDDQALIADVLTDVIAVAETADEQVPQAVIDALRDRGYRLAPLTDSPSPEADCVICSAGAWGSGEGGHAGGWREAMRFAHHAHAERTYRGHMSANGVLGAGPDSVIVDGDWLANLEDRLSPAAADTEPEVTRLVGVRVTFTYGVNSVRSTGTAASADDVDKTVELLRQQVEQDTHGLVDVAKVETRDVTESPWTEHTTSTNKENR